MSSTLKNLLLALALMVTLGFGYFVYFGNPQLEDISNSDIDHSIDTKAAQFIARLNELKTLSLNSDILSDPRFVSLRSFGTEVSPDTVGKENPFESE